MSIYVSKLGTSSKCVMRKLSILTWTGGNCVRAYWRAVTSWIAFQNHGDDEFRWGSRTRWKRYIQRTPSRACEVREHHGCRDPRRRLNRARELLDLGGSCLDQLKLEASQRPPDIHDRGPVVRCIWRQHEIRPRHGQEAVLELVESPDHETVCHGSVVRRRSHVAHRFVQDCCCCTFLSTGFEPNRHSIQHQPKSLQYFVIRGTKLV